MHRSTRGQEERASPRPLLGIGGTLAIVAILLAPFGTMLVTGQEPYPAVIFPGGGQIAVRVDEGRAVFEVDVLIGEQFDGTEEEIDGARILDPIPPSHLVGLIGTQFGQDRSTIKVVHVRRIGDVELPRHAPTAESAAQARGWISSQLSALELRPDKLAIRTYVVTVDHLTGAVLDRRLVEEVDLLD